MSFKLEKSWLDLTRSSYIFVLFSRSFNKFERMNDLELALIALDRMCCSVDAATKITVDQTRDYESEQTSKGEENNESKREHTWIATAQGTKQLELLSELEKGTPLFVEGPHFVWVRSKMVQYFMLKSDPLPKVAVKVKQIEEFDEDNVANMHNPFGNPYKKEFAVSKKPELSAYEMADGVVYAVCCTGTNTKDSLYYWTKILERKAPILKKTPIVFRIKSKPSDLADVTKLKQQENK
jgi:signaling intermediate in Toll pathway protein